MHISSGGRERKITNELIFTALVNIDSGQAISIFLEDSVPVDKNLFISDFKAFQLSLENYSKIIKPCKQMETVTVVRICLLFRW